MEFLMARALKYIILSSLLIISRPLSGQIWDLQDSLEFDHAIRIIKSDPQKNIYLNDVQGNVLKLDSTGNLIASFAPQQYGQITTMEPWPALRLFLYYENTQSYTFLDRYLSGEQFNRFPPSIGFASMAAASSDNQIWIIDDRAFSLLKYDFSFNQISLNSSFNQLPEKLDLDPYQMKEYQNRLYVGDHNYGVLVFDNIGNYIKSIPLPAPVIFNFMGDELYYLLEGAIHYIDLYHNDSRELILPGYHSYAQALILGRTAILASGNMLHIYHLTPR